MQPLYSMAKNSGILTYTARRRAIEVFFTDAKQMRLLGKEQSETFDVVVACYRLVMLIFLLLVYIFNKYQLAGPIGPLFMDLAEDHTQLVLAEKMWAYIKWLMITSSHLFWPEMEPNIFLYLLGIVEDAISIQVQTLTVKL